MLPSMMFAMERDRVDSWVKALVKPFLMPTAVILLAAVLLLHSGWVSISVSAVNFYYAAVFISGLLLAWRFHSSRVMFWLLVLLAAERALVFFSAGHPWSTEPGRTAFRAVSLLLPLNCAAFSFLPERGLTASTVGTRSLLLFLESVYVAFISRPAYAAEPSLTGLILLDFHWLHGTKVPQLALVAFLSVLAVVGTRFFRHPKPVEAGFFWSLVAVWLRLECGGVTPAATLYMATAGLIVAASLIETSYLMAYHDELTGLPARRAFNEFLVGLADPYAIAIVDVDHFKLFNDRYGHETGDQVLRLVASHLAHVSGGGRAYRCGGEEFSIVFAGKSASDAVEHLESLRRRIEQSRFKVRAQPERRGAPRGPDRRWSTPRRRAAPTSARAGTRYEVSVTVSIGVAEPSTKNRGVDQVIQAADKALYRAKQAGRNRIAVDTRARRQARAREETER